MPEEVNTGGSAPASPSYVQELIGPAADAPPAPAGEAASPPEGEQPPAPGETTPAEKPEAEAAAAAAEKLEVEQIIQQIAQEWGVDPNDPAHRPALKRIADKEAFIRTLQAEITTLKSGQKAGQEPGEDAALTDFERELLVEPQPDKTEPPAAEPPKKDAVPVASVSGPLEMLERAVGDWRSPDDAYHELTAAWARKNEEGESAPDLAKVNEIEHRQFLLRLRAAGVPVIKEIVADLLSETLGASAPELRSATEERRQAGAAAFARAELTKVPEMGEVIEKLFEVAEGPPIRFDGRDFPNTALNRILAAYPEILDIRVPSDDPELGLKATLIKQYRAAARIFRLDQQRQPAGLLPAKAKELVEAGVRMGAREELDRARQGINAGPGAGSLAGGASGSYIEHLSKLPGEVSINTLVRR